MAGPIVFISHFHVDDLEAYANMATQGASMIEAEKPRTAAFLHYLDRHAARVTIIHLFPDAAAMDLHFVGAQQRGSMAMQIMTPEGWEIFGPAGADAVATMRREAAAAGVSLTVQPEYVAGFLRLAA